MGGGEKKNLEKKKNKQTNKTHTTKKEEKKKKLVQLKNVTTWKKKIREGEDVWEKRKSVFTVESRFWLVPLLTISFCLLLCSSSFLFFSFFLSFFYFLFFFTPQQNNKNKTTQQQQKQKKKDREEANTVLVAVPSDLLPTSYIRAQATSEQGLLLISQAHMTSESISSTPFLEQM